MEPVQVRFPLHCPGSFQFHSLSLYWFHFSGHTVQSASESHSRSGKAPCTQTTAGMCCVYSMHVHCCRGHHYMQGHTHKHTSTFTHPPTNQYTHTHTHTHTHSHIHTHTHIHTHSHIHAHTQAISLSCTAGQLVSREVPFKNAGNIPLRVRLHTSPDSAHFTIAPDFLLMEPNEVHALPCIPLLLLLPLPPPIFVSTSQ